MNRSLRVGRIAGIPLHFHWTFLGVLLWIGYDSWWPGHGMVWDKFWWLSLLVSLVFFAVFCHELGHALVARQFGVGTSKIVLYPLGGGAFLKEIPKAPAKEIWIALAGPLTNFGLAAICALWIWLGPNPELQLFVQFFLDPIANIVVLVAPWEHLLVVFFVLNIVLGAFNLLPAFPLDGGRVLRAALSYHWPRNRATLLVARIGMISGVLLLLLAWYLGDAFFALGAILIFGLAAIEARIQHRRLRLENIRVSQHLETDFQRVYVNTQTTLAQVRALVRDLPPKMAVLLLDTWQEPQGVTSSEALLDPGLNAMSEDPFLTISKNPRWLALRPEDNLLTAAEKLDRHELFAFPVLDKYGRITGLLPTSVIQEVLK